MRARILAAGAAAALVSGAVVTRPLSPLDARAYTSGPTFVYVDDGTSTDAVSAFVAADDGSLTPVPGSPFPTGGRAGTAGYFVSDHSSMVQSANRLYVLDDASRTVTGFSVDPSSGSLTRLPGFPSALGFTASQYAMATAPGGTELFVAGYLGPAVYGWRLNADGSLGSLLTTAPVPGADGMAVSPDGSLLAVADGNGEVDVMGIDAAGRLSAPSVTASDCTAGVRFSPDGTHLYVGSCMPALSTFGAGGDGSLSPVASTALVDPQAVAVSSDGRRVFTGSPWSEGYLAALSVGADGQPVQTAGTETGTEITSLATNSRGTLLYASTYETGGVAGWTVDDAGALAPMPGGFVAVPGSPWTHSVVVMDMGMLPQTVVPAPVGAHTYGDAPFTVSATATPSGNPVSFSTTGPCAAGATSPVAGTVSTWSATVSLTGAGTCTLTATQSPGHGYVTGSASESFDIARATPLLTWPAPAPITYGTPLGATQLDATAGVTGFVTPPAGTLTYTLGDGATPADGAFLHAGSGQVLDAAFTPDDPADFTSATAQVTIDVLQAPQSVDVAAVAPHLAGDPPFTVSAVGGLSGLPVTFSAAAGGDCTLSGASSGVDEAGDGTGSVTVTLNGPGTCAITANQAGNGDYEAAPPVTVTISTSYSVRVLTDLLRTLRSGAAIPLRLELVSATGADLSAADVTVLAFTVDGGPVVAAGPPQGTTAFTYVRGAGDYRLVLRATGLGAGTHTLLVGVAGDPTVHTVVFTTG